MSDQSLPLKPYGVFYFIPVLVLLGVLIPFSLKQNTVYLSLCIIAVGCFAFILAVGYLFMFLPHQRDITGVLLMLVVILFYNPIILNYSLAFKLEAMNHQFLIFCNLCTAAIFIYLWWEMRKKNKKTPT